MAFTQQEIDQFHTAFKQAYLALASGVKSYTINVGGSSRSVTRADLPTIKKEFIYWARLRSKKRARPLPFSYVEPLDR